MFGKDGQQHNQGHDWQKADTRILGQIMVAQNVIFALPDSTRIAEFYAQTLISIPGISACRVCLEDVTVQQGDIDIEVCAECQTMRKKTAGEQGIFSPGFDCRLADQAGMHVTLINTLQHHFGFFIFQSTDHSTFNIYKPFIGNLASYIAVTLENRLQRGLLQQARAELERKVEERTQDLLTTNKQLQDEIETRRQAENALRESEERYRSLVEQASDGIFLADSRGNYLDVNSSGCKMLGYTRDEVLGLNMRNLASAGTQAQTPLRFDEIRSQKSIITERVLLTKSGGLLPVEISGTALDNGNLLGIVRDITERKMAEEALQRSNDLLRAIIQTAPTAIVALDLDGRVQTVWNPAAEKMLGWNAEEAIGKLLPSVPANAEIEFRRTIEMVQSGQIVNGIEARRQKRDGTPIDYGIYASPLHAADGRVTGSVAVLVDITERKQRDLEREAIITVSSALRKAATRMEILTVLLDQLVDLFAAKGAMLAFPNPSSGDILIEIGRGEVGERFTGLHIPPGQGISGWVIANKQPYLNNQAGADTRFYRADLLADAQCVAAVPLIAKEQVIGALWIARRTGLLEQDLRLFSAIGDIAANALYRVTLHEQTEIQLRQLMALHQIDIAITTNFDLTVTLNVILNGVKNELDVDAASILLLTPFTQTLDYAAGVGFRTRTIEQSHVKLGTSNAGQAALEYRTMSYPDLSQIPADFGFSMLIAVEGFTCHFVAPLIVKGQVRGVLEVFQRKPFEPEQDWLDYFETLATQTAIAIDNASLFENLQRSNTQLRLAYDATIEGWSRALDLRDKETEGHTLRVTEMALQLADHMGMSDIEKLHLRRGAQLHDIGKMGVPDGILLKPGPLSDDEWKIMRQHPAFAFEMLNSIEYLRPALDVPYCHHEKWDGSGYPQGLQGETIPLIARVFAVVDVFDALIVDRPYRRAWPREKVIAYIREQSGKHFDPRVVAAFLQIEL